MSPAAFRKLALDMPFAEEGSHMDHADFRIKGRIFATLPPPLKDRSNEHLGMVNLTPQQRQAIVAAYPNAFVAVPGAWGSRGATYVRLRHATPTAVRAVMWLAWSRVAPKALATEFERKPKG